MFAECLSSISLQKPREEKFKNYLSYVQFRISGMKTLKRPPLMLGFEYGARRTSMPLPIV